MKISIFLRIFFSIIFLGWLPVQGMDGLPEELLIGHGETSVGRYLDFADSGKLACASKGFNGIFGAPNVDYHNSKVAKWLDENEIWPLHYVALHARGLEAIKINDCDVACDVKKVVWDLVRLGHNPHCVAYILPFSRNVDDIFGPLDVSLKMENIVLAGWFQERLHCKKTLRLREHASTMSVLTEYLGQEREALGDKNLLVDIFHQPGGRRSFEADIKCLNSFNIANLNLVDFLSGDLELIFSCKNIQTSPIDIIVRAWKLVALPSIAGIQQLRNIQKFTLISSLINQAFNRQELAIMFSSMDMQRSLKLFELYENVFNGHLDLLPDEIGNLCALRELTIHSDAISSLPKTLENLVDLQNIAVVSDKFTNVAVQELCSYENIQESLRFLSISGCLNVDRLPKNIGMLKKLKILRLSNTGISSDDLRMLCLQENIQNSLEELFLTSVNLLDGLTAEIYSLKKLRYLDLRNTPLSLDDICMLCSQENIQNNLEVLVLPTFQDLPCEILQLKKLKNLSNVNLPCDRSEESINTLSSLESRGVVVEK
ncbi:hypothetical protein KAU11_02765 [Candidatus Babeliales bacterium]|nr:hypothetical protein [Candidatus Babeliales bacterium]